MWNRFVVLFFLVGGLLLPLAAPQSVCYSELSYSFNNFSLPSEYPVTITNNAGIQYFINTGSSTLYAEVYAPSKREAEGYVVTMNYSPGGTLEIVIGQGAVPSLSPSPTPSPPPHSPNTPMSSLSPSPTLSPPPHSPNSPPSGGSGGCRLSFSGALIPVVAAATTFGGLMRIGGGPNGGLLSSGGVAIGAALAATLLISDTLPTAHAQSDCSGPYIYFYLPNTPQIQPSGNGFSVTQTAPWGLLDGPGDTELSQTQIQLTGYYPTDGSDMPANIDASVDGGATWPYLNVGVGMYSGAWDTWVYGLDFGPGTYYIAARDSANHSSIAIDPVPQIIYPNTAPTTLTWTSGNALSTTIFAGFIAGAVEATGGTPQYSLVGTIEEGSSAGYTLYQLTDGNTWQIVVSDPSSLVSGTNTIVLSVASGNATVSDTFTFYVAEGITVPSSAMSFQLETTTELTDALPVGTVIGQASMASGYTNGYFSIYQQIAPFDAPSSFSSGLSMSSRFSVAYDQYLGSTNVVDHPSYKNPTFTPQWSNFSFPLQLPTASSTYNGTVVTTNSVSAMNETISLFWTDGIHVCLATFSFQVSMPVGPTFSVVGDGNFTSLMTTIEADTTGVYAGATVTVGPGVYTDAFTVQGAYDGWNDNGFVWPITLQGETGNPLPQFTGAWSFGNGKGRFETFGADVIFRGIEIYGIDQTTPGNPGNTAGIRINHLNLANIELNQCYIHNNDDGLLGGQYGDVITITNSEFAKNGDADGYTHNIYINSGYMLVVDNIVSWGANVGHNLKTRSMQSLVTNSIFSDVNPLWDFTAGCASYEVDIPDGGHHHHINNVYIKGVDGQNGPLVHYGDENLHQYEVNKLIIENGIFINYMPYNINPWNPVAIELGYIAAGPYSVEVINCQFYGFQNNSIINVDWDGNPANITEIGSQYLPLSAAPNVDFTHPFAPPYDPPTVAPSPYLYGPETGQ